MPICIDPTHRAKDHSFVKKSIRHASIVGNQTVGLISDKELQEMKETEKNNQENNDQTQLEICEQVREIWMCISELLEVFFFIIFTWFIGMVDIFIKFYASHTDKL